MRFQLSSHPSHAILSHPPTRTAALRAATLIYNPISGRRPARREKEIQKAALALREGGLSVKLAQTSGPDTARELARTAAAEGSDLVIVCGGDGTINEVINGLAPGGTTLAVLPGGTANIVARELGVPLDPVRAARELASWSPRRIALGRVTWPGQGTAAGADLKTESRYFVSVAGIGFDAYVVYKLCPAFKTAWGVAAYCAEAIRQVLRYPFPSFACQVDDRKLSGTFAVVQRTRRYGGWLHLAPHADLFKDEVTFCLFKDHRAWRYFVYAAAVLGRQHLRLRDVNLTQGQKIACAAKRAGDRIYFELDGELAGVLPATFEVVPDALTLLTPRDRVNS